MKSVRKVNEKYVMGNTTKNGIIQNQKNISILNDSTSTKDQKVERTHVSLV